MSSLRNQFEQEQKEKHLFDVVQIRPFPTWEYVEWLEKLVEEKLKADNSASPKLPPFEEIWKYVEKNCATMGPMGMHAGKYFSKIVYDYIGGKIGQ